MVERYGRRSNSSSLQHIIIIIIISAVGHRVPGRRGFWARSEEGGGNRAPFSRTYTSDIPSTHMPILRKNIYNIIIIIYNITATRVRTADKCARVYTLNCEPVGVRGQVVCTCNTCLLSDHLPGTCQLPCVCVFVWALWSTYCIL